jgi:hypothetical protein
MIDLYLYRDTLAADFTLGELTVDGKHFGFTCEDTDRKLEDGGEKVYGKTAIPRGRYKVILSFSPHFDRITPEILDVPGFTGVRIHGGNTNADTFGCPLLGRDRTDNGVANCTERNKALIELLERAEDFGEETWITIS